MTLMAWTNAIARSVNKWPKDVSARLAATMIWGSFGRIYEAEVRSHLLGRCKRIYVQDIGAVLNPLIPIPENVRIYAGDDVCEHLQALMNESMVCIREKFIRITKTRKINDKNLKAVRTILYAGGRRQMIELIQSCEEDYSKYGDDIADADSVDELVQDQVEFWVEKQYKTVTNELRIGKIQHEVCWMDYLTKTYTEKLNTKFQMHLSSEYSGALGMLWKQTRLGVAIARKKWADKTGTDIEEYAMTKEEKNVSLLYWRGDVWKEEYLKLQKELARKRKNEAQGGPKPKKPRT